MTMNLKTALTALAVICAGTASIAEPVTLKLATGFAEPTVWSDQMRSYKAKVEELSDGDVKIDIFYAGQLGSMGDTLKSTLRGRVDLWLGSVPILSGVSPELNTLVLPYLFEDDQQAVCVVPKMTDAAQVIAGNKYKILALLPVEHQAIAGLVPLTDIGMLQGMKVRSAPSQASVNFFLSVGATPLPIPAEETPSAASTGLVSGVNFGLAYAMASGLTQTLKVYTRADLQFNLTALLVSPSSLKKLSDDQRAVLTEALSVLEFGQMTDEVMNAEKQMSDELESKGGRVVFLTPEQTTKWKEAARATWEQSLKDLGGESRGLFDAIEAAKIECGS